MSETGAGTPHALVSQVRRIAELISFAVFAWGANAGVSPLHRFRDAVGNACRRPFELDEHSVVAPGDPYVAGASGLPFAVLRGYAGTDLPAQNPTIAPVTCPFTDERLTAVAFLGAARIDRVRRHQRHRRRRRRATRCPPAGRGGRSRDRVQLWRGAA